MAKIIQVENLKKSYGSVQAVKGISFEVEKGSLFAFLGTNGAGKSTTIDILSTLLKKDSGTVYVNNYEVCRQDKEIRKDIGVVFQNGVLDDLLTVKENLTVRGSFYGYKGKDFKERITKATEITGCLEFVDRRYGTLSGGQKRRADIARALINNPQILFLDEPTTGLDPKTRQSIWNTISEMQKKYEMTVFLTTHYMEEAANSDSITIINQGTIISTGTPNELKEKYTFDVLKIYHPNEDIIAYVNRKRIKYALEKEALIIKFKSPSEAIRILADLESSIPSFEVIHGNLDDVFLTVTNQNEEDVKC